MLFLPCTDPNVSTPTDSKATGHCGACKEATVTLPAHSNNRISSWFSKVGPLLLWVCCRNCMCKARLFVSLFTCLEKPRTGTGHACRVVHSAHTPSKMIWLTLTILSAHITTRISHVETCLSAITSSGQQMKNHIKECSGLAPPPTALQESVPSGHLPKNECSWLQTRARQKERLPFREIPTSQPGLSGLSSQ